MAVEQHRRTAPGTVRCAVLTVSDTRTSDTDSSGDAIAALLTEAGHAVAARKLVRDEPSQISGALDDFLAQDGVRVVITTGGTGISRRDSTFEVVDALLEKRLDGFGELFRMLSYTEIGPAAMLSRACAGTCRGRVLIALPGSEAAVRLALQKLLLPELGHLVREVTR
jgi:molybdenum cofactor biosynthesis protein B